jgi:chromosome segregation ATPase
VYTNT